jgi:hypothetical protein
MLVNLGTPRRQVGEHVRTVIGLDGTVTPASILRQAGMAGVAVFRRDHPLTHAEHRGCFDFTVETERMVMVFL